MRKIKRFIVSVCFLTGLLTRFVSYAAGETEFLTQAPYIRTGQNLLLRSNVFPWIMAVPNLGAEYMIGQRWSAVIDVWYCPWKIADKFSIKTIAVLPEGRWWLKTNSRGSFFNIHFNLAWYNVRAGHFRYQDESRPLLGGGIGYGYRLDLGKNWGLEFEIGAGFINTRYNRFYNISNGALKDSRVSTYWGIDRLGLTFSYIISRL